MCYWLNATVFTDDSILGKAITAIYWKLDNCIEKHTCQRTIPTAHCSI
jgi:hypothetical protein